MSLKELGKAVQNIITIGVVGLGAVTTLHLATNWLASGQYIKEYGYGIKIVRKLPFTSMKNKSFECYYNTIENCLKSELYLGNTGDSDKIIGIEDNNGDFKPDTYYQGLGRLLELDRKENLKFFEHYVDKVWEREMRNLNVADLHKEWMLKYGKDLLDNY